MTLEELKNKTCVLFNITEEDFMKKQTKECSCARAMFCFHARSIEFNKNIVIQYLNMTVPTYYKSLQRHRNFVKFDKAYKGISQKLQDDKA